MCVQWLPFFRIYKHPNQNWSIWKIDNSTSKARALQNRVSTYDLQNKNTNFFGEMRMKIPRVKHSSTKKQVKRGNKYVYRACDAQSPSFAHFVHVEIKTTAFMSYSLSLSTAPQCVHARANKSNQAITHLETHTTAFSTFPATSHSVLAHTDD